MGKLLPTLMKDPAKFNEIMTKELQKQVEQSLAKKTKEDKTEVKQTSPADERSKLQALILNNERNKNHNQELRNEEEEKKLARIQKADSAKQQPPQ